LVSLKIQTYISQEDAIINKLKANYGKSGGFSNSFEVVALLLEELEMQWRGRRHLWSFVTLLVWVLSQSLLSGLFSVLFQAI